MLLARLLLLFSMPVGLFAAENIWLEGESPKSHNFVKHGWYDDVAKEGMSGKQWLSLVATMRKIKGSANGGWRWEEFTRSSPTARFTKIAFPESSCAACHAQAKTNDYIYTKR